MITHELEDFLIKEGYSHVREIPGKGVCGLFRFIYTWGLVVGIDSVGYKGRYCYSNHTEALGAILSWTGEDDPPFRWIKYKGEGGERARTPDDENTST